MILYFQKVKQSKSQSNNIENKRLSLRVADLCSTPDTLYVH